MENKIALAFEDLLEKGIQRGTKKKDNPDYEPVYQGTKIVGYRKKGSVDVKREGHAEHVKNNSKLHAVGTKVKYKDKSGNDVHGEVVKHGVNHGDKGHLIHIKDNKGKLVARYSHNVQEHVETAKNKQPKAKVEKEIDKLTTPKEKVTEDSSKFADLTNQIGNNLFRIDDKFKGNKTGKKRAVENLFDEIDNKHHDYTKTEHGKKTMKLLEDYIANIPSSNGGGGIRLNLIAHLDGNDPKRNKIKESLQSIKDAKKAKAKTPTKKEKVKAGKEEALKAKPKTEPKPEDELVDKLMPNTPVGGKTPAGKWVYANLKGNNEMAYGDFNSKDHNDAATLLMEKHKSTGKEVYRKAAETHKAEAVRKLKGDNKKTEPKTTGGMPTPEEMKSINKELSRGNIEDGRNSVGFVAFQQTVKGKKELLLVIHADGKKGRIADAVDRAASYGRASKVYVPDGYEVDFSQVHNPFTDRFSSIRELKADEAKHGYSEWNEYQDAEYSGSVAYKMTKKGKK